MPTREEPPDRTAAAMGERVARMEVMVEGLNKGQDVIRANSHAIFGEMQKFVAAETQCVTHLAAIRELTAHLPEIVAKVQSFDELKPRLTTLIDEHFARKGGWRAVIMAGSATLGAVTIMGTLGSLVVWLIDKVTWH